jgi:hypothetical protein
MSDETNEGFVMELIEEVDKNGDGEVIFFSSKQIDFVPGVQRHDDQDYLQGLMGRERAKFLRVKFCQASNV